MELRPYQANVIEDLWSWFSRNDDGNPIVEAAVGAGKSLMIAAVAQRCNREAPGTRILVLVHQKELLEQNVDKIIRVWPSVDIGIYSAGAGRKQLNAQVTYATIGSIYKVARELGRIDMVMADECHLINPKELGMWRSFIAELSRYCPHVRVVGWTGTPFRGNGVWLTAEKDSLFTHIAARVTMKQLLADGFLSPLIPATTTTKISTEGVATSNGDYVVSQLAAQADKAEVVEAACDEIVQLAAERRRWLVFAVNLEHAEHVTQALKRRNVAAEMIDGTMPKGERAYKVAAYRRGQIKCLVNVGVATTGFDVPEIDFIALLRATKSPVLYVQIGGRGMRLARGKTDCMWADFTNTTLMMGPIDDVKGRNPSPKGGGEAPFRLCEKCGSRNHASARLCCDCGHPFPEPETIKHGDKASDAIVLSSQASSKIKVYDVIEVRYGVHEKFGSPDSMVVEYFAKNRNGMQKLVAREWVALDHGDSSRVRAELWWQKRTPRASSVPHTVADAVVIAQGGGLLMPRQITVDETGRYPEITRYTWDGIPA